MVLSSCEEKKEVRFMLSLLLVVPSLVERGSLVVAAIATAAEQMMMTELQHASKPLRCLGKCIEEKQSMDR